MKYITLPDEKMRRLSFYLAMEEYVAHYVSEPECFFMWQVEPSVIFGRHQVAENEVNIDYCHENGISVYRRKSGGGCVYADLDNVMLSYVTDGDQVGFTFNKFVNMILLVMRKLGIEAVGSKSVAQHSISYRDEVSYTALCSMIRIWNICSMPLHQVRRSCRKKVSRVYASASLC